MKYWKSVHEGATECVTDDPSSQPIARKAAEQGLEEIQIPPEAAKDCNILQNDLRPRRRMTKPLHSLVIGTGAIGQRHLRHLLEIDPEGTFTFLRRDRSPRDVDEVYRPSIATDLDEAISHRPDLAIVASPSARHIDVLPGLIAANIPLYVEKPIVIVDRDVEVVCAALDRADPAVPRLAGFNFRYLPSLMKLASLIREGGLGRLVRAHLSAGQWLPDWRPQTDYRQTYSAQRALGGGVLFDLIHEIDLCRWWFGAPKECRAMIGRFSRLDMDVEDSCTALMRFPEGPLVSVGLDYVARQRLRRYEIVGDEGTAIWDLKAKRLFVERSGGEVEDVTSDPDDFDVAKTYPHALTEIVSAIRNHQTEGIWPAALKARQDLACGLDSSRLAIRLKEIAE